MKISWDDLQIKMSSENIEAVYVQWPGLTGNKIKPLFISSFGDLFFLKADSMVYHLDVIDLQIRCLNFEEEAFPNYINNENTIKDVLLSVFILDIKNRGIIRDPHKSYAFAPHPKFTNKISPDQVTVMDLRPWINICSQLIGK
jgi:hypothetical protein